MRLKKQIAVLVAAFLAFAVILPVFAADDTPVGRYLIQIPEDKKLTVRANPSSQAEAIDYLYNGDPVEIVDVVNGWARARKNGVFGWFDAQYAQLQQEYECAYLIADISTAGASSVDFNTLAAAGVDGVLLRFGVSANHAEVVAMDANYEANYEAAKAAGLAVGVYFASSAVNSAQIIREYEWVLQSLAERDDSFTLPVFYRPTTAEQKALPSAENTLLVSAFCQQMTANGYQAGIYLPYDWTSQNMDFSALNAYTRWIADFGDYCNFTRSFDLWQYTAAEAFEGVDGEIGLSYLVRDIITDEPQESTESEPTESEPTETEPTEPVPEESTTAVSVLPEHTMGEFVVVREPGCSTCGEERAYCVDCGKLLAMRVTEPTGHRDSLWQTLRPATAEQGGILIRRCDICGEITKMQFTQPLESSHIHLFSDWTYIDAVQDSILHNTLREEGLTGEQTDTQTRTACTVDRERVLTCTDCGEVVAVYADTPAAHTPVESPAVVTADCENDGHSRVLCRDCGLVLTDEVTPAYGHDVAEWEIVKAPTPEEEGERQGTCARCHQTVREAIPKLEAILGDVNGDSRVTSADARLVLRVSVQLETLSDDAALAAADYNGDGRITSADARLILRAAVGLDAQ